MMYVSVYYKLVPMPVQEKEDVAVRTEATLLLCCNRLLPEDPDAITEIGEEQGQEQQVFYEQVDGVSLVVTPRQPDKAPLITLAMVEGGYIILWISKDMFWSFGTGEMNRQRDSIQAYEALAMAAGFAALCAYFVTAYIYRRHTLHFIDSLTIIFWICANYTWMCGEFFIRYRNYEFDDVDPGNDTNTRLASAVCFGAGICCQLYVVTVELWEAYGGCMPRQRRAAMPAVLKEP